MTPLARYQWYKPGMNYVVYEATLYAEQSGDFSVWGEHSLPSTVAEAIKFMFKVSAERLVVDEYTIVELE